MQVLQKLIKQFGKYVSNFKRKILRKIYGALHEGYIQDDSLSSSVLVIHVSPVFGPFQSSHSVETPIFTKR